MTSKAKKAKASRKAKKVFDPYGDYAKANPYDPMPGHLPRNLLRALETSKRWR
jgi:hypothetical protein